MVWVKRKGQGRMAIRRKPVKETKIFFSQQDNAVMGMGIEMSYGLRLMGCGRERPAPCRRGITSFQI